MLYEALKEPLLSLLRAPHQPPDPPLGSPGSEEIFRASPRYLTLQLLQHFGSLGTALAFELVAWAMMPAPSELVPIWGGATFFALAVGVVVAMTLLTMLARYFLIRLDYDMRYYVLTDRSLRIRRGALTIEESTYTFANVQNLTLHQGPLERWLGITHLQLDTAGGGAQKGAEGGENLHHHGRLDGIDLQTATELRDRISSLVRGYRDAGLGDEPAVATAGADPTDRRAAVLRTIIEELRQIRPTSAQRAREPN
jgi:membrane protein YdbS with pleckstrin-like domain